MTIAGIYTDVKVGDQTVEVLLPMDEYKRAHSE
jgi:hypothetical protein